MAKNTQIVDIYAANLPIKESVSGTEKIVVSDGDENKGIEISKVKEYATEGVATTEDLYNFIPNLRASILDYKNNTYFPYCFNSTALAKISFYDLCDTILASNNDMAVVREYYSLDGAHPAYFPCGIKLANKREWTDIYYDERANQIVVNSTTHFHRLDVNSIQSNIAGTTKSSVYNAVGSITEVYNKTEVDEKLSAKADTTTASTTSDGLMSKEDKAKLDGLSPKEQLFIDMWNSACGTYGKYNTETGFYELNGLTDITYEQALAIYRVIGCETSNVYRPNVRTILFSGCSAMTILTWQRFLNCDKLEVVKHSNYVNYNNTVDSMFDGCVNLKAILGLVNINNITSYSYMFRRCVKLENFTFKGLNSNLTISDSPLITYNTLNYLISNALGNKVTTVSVHPTTYAYLQGTTLPTEQVGGTTEQWQALVTAATNKKISFATTK
ncbi:hypothetical protein [Prevotellamassilia timonensis]|uniref:hypothetical protein n=1 Tax=Prevotellamassilia timonensis TaxID=1852370 RepID=UPI0023F30DA4|nr:hypothetical protein [Prevotellamassilia timonensis]MDD7440076.1 hypothetical protein [Prevotellamassilia timonensis]